MTGKGFRPRVMRIGRWRYVTAAVFLIYFALVVVLPFLVLLWSSLQRFYSVPSLAALKNLTLDSYRTVLAYPAIGTAVWNSIVLALGSATLIMLVTSVLCWIVVRTKLPGRWLLDNLASLPLVFPGLVLGLAIMICYLALPIGVYGTIWIMLIAYVTRFLPYGMRYNTTSMLQVHKELEESAAMSGASLAHDVPPHRAAAAQARPDRRLDLHRHRLDPGTVQLDPALQPRHRSGLGHDLGVVAEWPIRRAIGARRHDDLGAVLLRHAGRSFSVGGSASPEA